MCLYSKPDKVASVAAPVTPAPIPAPVPTDVSPITDAAARNRETERLKKGFLSTVKTGPQGTTGAGPDLASTSAAGVLYPSMGTRKTIG